ncbi:MAG: FAD synthase, partial [Patescibacteria group bacterium]
VVVARDINVKKIKGHNPDKNENVRLREVHAVKPVDKAVLGYKFNRYKIIKELRPNVICLGYDQKVEIEELQSQLKNLNVSPQIFRLKPFHPEIYKSSIIRNKNAA